MYMSMGDIGDIHVFSSSKEFGIILIPEVEFTSFVIHFVFSFRVSISSNFQKQIILSSSTPYNVGMGSVCPMLQAISIS